MMTVRFTHGVMGRTTWSTADQIKLIVTWGDKVLVENATRNLLVEVPWHQVLHVEHRRTEQVDFVEKEKPTRVVSRRKKK